MSMTLPQILVLNHAASVNQKRADERYERKRAREQEETESKQRDDEADPIVWRGKRLGEMNSDEMMAYYSDM